MEDTPPSPRNFAQHQLPWLIAGAALLLYLLTLNPWVGINSLQLTAQLSGWEGSLPYDRPLLWLVGLPLHLLPAAKLPAAANALAALFAAAALATLARCVALLPHDRTREQRVRGHSEDTLLHIPLAWLPPLFAALLLGLQLTFWEDATAQTGEMLDLLIFAVCVRCLLEYRLDLRESWLWRFALLYGAGAAGNWAMIAFAPLFVIALCWIRGVAILNAGFLARLAAWFAVGLLAYLLTPLASQWQRGGDLGFWPVLRSVLAGQRNYLLGLPRGRYLLLALVTLLPLVLVGIRWRGGQGSRLETMLSNGAVIVLKFGFLGSALYMAFDPAFSPRQLVRLEAQQGGLSLLTFSFCGALAAGYFAGYFLLVGARRPDNSWARPPAGLSALGRLSLVLVLAATVAVPAALAVRNWPVMRAQNGRALDRLARGLTAQLPPRPTVLITDDSTLYLLLASHFTRAGGSSHLLFNNQSAPQESYRQWLLKEHGSAWPELDAFAKAKDNVAVPFLQLVKRTAANQDAFYLNPALNFITEQFQPRLAGAIYRLAAYPAGSAVGPVPTAAETAATKAYWERLAPELAELTAEARLGALNAKEAARLWARAANTDGLILQQAGDLDAAAPLLALAAQLNPDNVAAAVNLRVNAALRAHQPLGEEVRKPLAEVSLERVLSEDGPIDEPQTLFKVGRTVEVNASPLPRAAAVCFLRAKQLDPAFTLAQLGYISACLNAHESTMALAAIHELRAQGGLTPEDLPKLVHLEFDALTQRADLKGAESLLLKSREQLPKHPVTYDLLSLLYLQQERYEESLQQLTLWAALQPENNTIAFRRVITLMSRKQFDQALPLVEKLVRELPENEFARVNRAICLLQLNRLDDARRDYELLLRKHPEQHILHYGLGEVAEKKQETADAIEHFQRYLALAPTNTVEYTNVLARLQRLQGGK